MGELYLMPGLKKLCANHLISMIDVENVVDLIRMSRTYQLPRLETFCSEFIAKHLAEVGVKFMFILYLFPKFINWFTDVGSGRVSSAHLGGRS